MGFDLFEKSEKNDKDAAFRRRLIEALTNDEEVRRLICAMQAQGVAGEEKGEGKKETRWHERYDRLLETTQALEKERDALQKKLDAANSDIAGAKELFNDIEWQYEGQSKKLEQCQSSLAVMTQRAEAAERQLAVAKRKLDATEQERRDAVATRDKALRERDDAARARAEAERSCEAAQQARAAAEEENRSLARELEQRFAQGKELYEQLDHVDAYIRSLLDGAIPRKGFEAFIVGLAQDRSLPFVWEAVREAMRKGCGTEELTTLWEIFQYAIALVNQGKSQDIYAIDDVQAGDVFDVDEHTLVDGSRAQGSITEVVLPGYRNTYSGEIVKKSLVRI